MKYPIQTTTYIQKNINTEMGLECHERSEPIPIIYIYIKFDKYNVRTNKNRNWSEIGYQWGGLFPKHAAPSTRYQVLGDKSLVSCTWYRPAP